MMLDYKKLLESLLRELIDKKIISEWYCNGVGYFWKYNEKDKRILKLEKENAELKEKLNIRICQNCKHKINLALMTEVVNNTVSGKVMKIHKIIKEIEK